MSGSSQCDDRKDFALNDNTDASAVTPSVHIDTIVPTVAISGAPVIEKNVPFDLTVTFSEAVNGFAVPADSDGHRTRHSEFDVGG